MYNLSEVKFKFLGDKTGPTKGFYLEVWKIDSVFVYQVYFLKVIYEGLYLVYIYVRRTKRRLNMILNSRCESFSKTVMFLQTFQKLPKTYSK